MKKCILCGQEHEPAEGCDYSTFDPILANKLNIKVKEANTPFDKTLESANIKKKRGRPRKEE